MEKVGEVLEKGANGWRAEDTPGEELELRKGEYRIVDKNYTPMPHRLMMSVMRQVPRLTEQRLVLWLIRETYGYNYKKGRPKVRRRWRNRITIDRLAKDLKRKPRAIKKALKALKKQGIIIEDEKRRWAIGKSVWVWRKDLDKGDTKTKKHRIRKD